MGTIEYRSHPDSVVGLLFAHPDRLDVIEGEPLSTRSGRYLKHALHDAGIKPYDCYIDYLMCSYPGRKGFTSIEAQDEIAEYKPHLQAHLKAQKKLKVIILFGPEILPYFNIQGSLTKTRGFVFDNFPVPVIPTYHPLFIFSGVEDITFLNDLEKASQIALKGYTRPHEDFLLGPSIEIVRNFLRPLRAGKIRIFVDIEAIGSLNNRDQNEITVIGIQNEESKRVLVIPLIAQGGVRYWAREEEEEVRSLLQEVLTVSPCIFHNGEYDCKHLNYQGFGPVRIGGDTMLLHHALHPELPHTLDYVTSIYGNIPYWKSTLKQARNQLDIPNKEFWTYNARDCLATGQIEPELTKECKEQETYKIYSDISVPMLDVVLEMNNNGLPVDATRLVNWRASLEHKNNTILDNMSNLWEIHPAFNWDSRQHVAWLFYGLRPTTFVNKKAEYAEYFEQGSKKKKNTKKFKTLEEYINVFEQTKPFRKLPELTVKTTKTGASTDDEMRVRMGEAIIKRVDKLLNMIKPREDHEQEASDLAAMRQIIDNLKEYAINIKLLSTYTKLHIEPDGRIHPGFKVHGTKTGRLSSYSPSGHTLPAEAKKIFVAPEGWNFIQFDYTNLELVVLAYVAQIKYLIDVFKKGLNVHDENTKKFLHITEDNPFWSEWRRVMKMYVFGRNYGGGLKGMYRRMLLEIPGLQMTLKQFTELDANYFKLMPEYSVWYDKTVEEVKTTRTLRNAFGRIRIFLGKMDEIVREGLNFPIQGTAADIMGYGLIDLFKEYKRAKEANLQMELNLSVHDSVVMLAPKRENLIVLKMLKRCMCAPRKIGEDEISFQGNVKIMNDLKGEEKDEKKLDEWIKVYEEKKKSIA